MPGLKDAIKELGTLTADELAEIVIRASELRETIQEQERENLAAKFEELAAGLGISAAQVLRMRQPKGKKSTGAKRAPVKPKYRDPKNSANTWSGRGRAPNWFSARIDDGVKREDMLIS